MCTSTNRMKTMPLAAMSSFSAIVERVERTPLTSSVVATTQHDTRGDGRRVRWGRVTYARLPGGHLGAGGPEAVPAEQLVDRCRPVPLEGELAPAIAQVAAPRVGRERRHRLGEPRRRDGVVQQAALEVADQLRGATGPRRDDGYAGRAGLAQHVAARLRPPGVHQDVEARQGDGQVAGAERADQLGA